MEARRKPSEKNEAGYPYQLRQSNKFSTASDTEAEAMLQGKNPGVFLVRGFSSQEQLSDQQYLLAVSYVNNDDQVKHECDLITVLPKLKNPGVTFVTRVSFGNDEHTAKSYEHTDEFNEVVNKISKILKSLDLNPVYLPISRYGSASTTSVTQLRDGIFNYTSSSTSSVCNESDGEEDVCESPPQKRQKLNPCPSSKEEPEVTCTATTSMRF